MVDTRSKQGNTAAVVRRVGYSLTLLAFLAAMGAHWFVLQSVAWTTMLAENLRQTSLPQAVERTFDGKHPCALCKRISQGKQSEKKTEFRAEPAKFEFSYAPATFVFAAPQSFWEVRTPDMSGNLLAHAPPLPPPRSLHG